MKGLVSMTVFASAAFALAGCYGYEPRVAADRTSPAYQADLAACQDEAVDAVNKRNAKTGLDWFSSPVRRPFQIRAAIRACVAKKGYTIISYRGVSYRGVS